MLDESERAFDASSARVSSSVGGGNGHPSDLSIGIAWLGDDGDGPTAGGDALSRVNDVASSTFSAAGGDVTSPMSARRRCRCGLDRVGMARDVGGQRSGCSNADVRAAAPGHSAALRRGQQKVTGGQEHGHLARPRQTPVNVDEGLG